jgi:threonine dehydrogenase-like Zn-dependent dehydrogenase
LNRSMVLENDVVFGSVNANRRHYEAAAIALAQADPAWLERLVTRRVPLAEWSQAYERQPHDVKTVLDFQS